MSSRWEYEAPPQEDLSIPRHGQVCTGPRRCQANYA
jgi:hypothetical protein